MAECKWCGSEDGCDCIERMECNKVGQPGHYYCGKRPCGKPRFIVCNCQKCNEVAATSNK